MTRNPNDAIREAMLSYFYERNANATSERGRRGSQVGIRDVKRELKEQHGLAQQQVMANLSYLIDSGWVERIEEQRTFQTRRGTRQPSTSVRYKITNTGIDLIEGESSAFRRADPFAASISRQSGARCRLATTTTPARDSMACPLIWTLCRDELVGSSTLDEPTKVAAAADIETLKMQIAKPEPNRTIVDAAWTGRREDLCRYRVRGPGYQHRGPVARFVLGRRRTLADATPLRRDFDGPSESVSPAALIGSGTSVGRLNAPPRLQEMGSTAPVASIASTYASRKRFGLLSQARRPVSEPR